MRDEHVEFFHIDAKRLAAQTSRRWTNMDSLKSVLDRPKAYYNVDGVGELGIGFMCLGYALLSWIQLHAPKNSAWHQGYAGMAYLAVMVAIIHYGSKAIKNRITYRRTGFVDYKPRDKYWIPMTLGAAVSVLFSAGLYLAVRRHWDISTPVTLAGLVLAASYIRIARTVRWKWVIFCVLVAGVLVIAWLPADLAESFANHTSLTSAIPAKAVGAYWLTFVVYGAVLMISGSISFWLYLLHTEAPAPEDV
jgi:uncharacterized membrane protein YhaH (DUF805 family)